MWLTGQDVIKSFLVKKTESRYCVQSFCAAQDLTCRRLKRAIAERELP